MHVDTGTDLDFVSHFVGPQSGDKSILGTVSSLKQGSQQDSFKSWSVHSQITIQNDHFRFSLLKNGGECGARTKNNISKSNNKTLKFIISLILSWMEMIKVTVTNILTHKNSGLTPEPSDIIYHTLLNTGWPYCIFCPERLSKPVLRILSNVIKYRKINHRKLTISFCYKQTKKRSDIQIKKKTTIPRTANQAQVVWSIIKAS